MERVSEIIPYLESIAQVGQYCEWRPIDAIDQAELANMTPQQIKELNRIRVGLIRRKQWITVEDEGGWCYLVQPVGPTGELQDEPWWLDEEIIALQNIPNRRIPSPNEVEVLAPQQYQRPVDLACPLPLWWRAKNVRP
jgi:hypothetical protein